MFLPPGGAAQSLLAGAGPYGDQAKAGSRVGSDRSWQRQIIALA
jgi:hypothetical protein